MKPDKTLDDKLGPIQNGLIKPRAKICHLFKQMMIGMQPDACNL